jgi:hypothetical protein
MYIGRLSLKGTWKGILEVSAFLVYYITVLCPSTSQITFRKSRVEWLLPQSESDSRGASLGGARGTQESERYLGHFFFPSLSFLFLIRNVVGESSRHGRGGSLPWCKTERGSPTIHNQLRIRMAIRMQ